MINLLPFEARETIEYAGRIHALNRFSFLLFSIVGGAAFVMATSIFFLRSQSAALTSSVNKQQQTLTQLEPILARADRVEEKVEIASKILESEVRFSELLVEIGSVLPAGTRIEGITIGEDLSTPLTITVIASEYSDALAGVVRENIIGSDLFEAADIQNVNIGSSDNDSNALSTISVVALLKNGSKPSTVDTAPSTDSFDETEGDSGGVADEL